MNPRMEFTSLGNLLAGTSPFRPFAYFDAPMDAVRVQILDCSIREDRLNQFLTVYYPNHSTQSTAQIGVGAPVGFAIKGIGHLFERLGLKAEGVMSLSSLLDSMVKSLPAYATRMVLETFNAWPDDKPKEVDFAVKEAA